MSQIQKIEPKIMDCWNLLEDLKVLNEGILERDLSKDDISNVLVGLTTLYQLRFEQLFSEYERSLKSGGT